MKKILSIALAVVMVLSIASVAAAFDWNPPTTTAADNSNFGYSVDVIKFTKSTAPLGDFSYNIDDAATAVNDAHVYYAIKLSVGEPSKDIKEVAKLKIKITGLEGIVSGTYEHSFNLKDLTNLADGNDYYLNAEQLKILGTKGDASKLFQLIADTPTPIIKATCKDTETAKVTATVTAERNLAEDVYFNVGDYDVCIYKDNVCFRKADNTLGNGELVAVFFRNGDDKVYAHATSTATVPAEWAGVFATPGAKWTTDAYAAFTLYGWLNNNNATEFSAALKAGDVYMTDSNLRKAFGFSFKSTDSATWAANSTPIILDPTVSIPKTGDNASVIGFAMIMVAVVAAAVAVRKVNA